MPGKRMRQLFKVWPGMDGVQEQEQQQQETAVAERDWRRRRGEEEGGGGTGLEVRLLTANAEAQLNMC
jgi:hypothetical protein